MSVSDRDMSKNSVYFVKQFCYLKDTVENKNTCVDREYVYNHAFYNGLVFKI